MKTSCFYLYRGPGRISIARWAPRNHPAGFKIYRPLAPGDWSRIKAADGRSRWIADEPFMRGYAAQLASLDPQQVYGELLALVAPHEPVLLCWETPPPNDTGKQWCHRQQVARWFFDQLGIEVPELDTSR